MTRPINGPESFGMGCTSGSADRRRSWTFLSKKTFQPTILSEKDNLPHLEYCFKYSCSFDACKDKTWMLFSSDQDLHDHISRAHRCQWLVADDTYYKPCNYIPRTEEEFVAHVQAHICQGEFIVQRYVR